MKDLLVCVQGDDFPGEVPHAFLLPDASPVVLCGPVDILKLRRVAVLNSRQSPRFGGDSSWVENTFAALRSLDPSRDAVLSSTGTTAWDLLTWSAGKMGFAVVLVFPGGSAQNFKIARTKAMINLGLESPRTLALRPLLLKRYRKKEESHALRDRWVLGLANEILPVSINPRGNLAGYLNSSQIRQETIHRSFQLEPPSKRSPRRRPRLPHRINPPRWYSADDYLIHWTRSCVGPWPDETTADYFTRLEEGGWQEPTGLETLQNILRKGIIRSSSHLIRGGYGVVSFTERPPQDLPRLAGWRPGLRRWNFEPYGLALKKPKLERIGARKVIYGELNEFIAMPEKDRAFFQAAKSDKNDWRTEKEWRIRGDVDLYRFSKGEGVVIVNHINESFLLPKNLPFRVFALNSR